MSRPTRMRNAALFGGSKYRAKPCVVDGIRFASIAEGRRYQELQMLLRAGAVYRVTRQPRWSFDLNGVHIGHYTADFEVVYPNGEVVIEDVKGVATRDYVLRKKLLLAIYGLDVTEIRRASTRRRWAA